MSNKGIYAFGIVLFLGLMTVFNCYDLNEPEPARVIQPVAGTDTLGDIGKPVLADEPIEPIETETTTTAETTSGRVYMGKYKLTAYCSCYDCCKKWGARTASGTAPKQGRTIAVDPSVIPYGTSVYIEGYGTYIAEDTGGAIKNNDQYGRIDVYFNDHEEALIFGVRYADVYLED